MGIYLNPGNDGFREAVRSEIYVDKTELIAFTNKYESTEQKFVPSVLPITVQEKIINSSANYLQDGDLQMLYLYHFRIHQSPHWL